MFGRRYIEENGIRLAEVTGSFLSRGLYPVFAEEFDAPGNPSAWRVPGGDVVFAHPRRPAIPLYTVRDLSGRDGSYGREGGGLAGNRTSIAWEEVGEEFRRNWPLGDTDTLEWVHQGVSRNAADGRVVLVSADFEGRREEFDHSEALYALRRKTRGGARDRFWDWAWEKRIDRTLDAAIFYTIFNLLLVGAVVAPPLLAREAVTLRWFDTLVIALCASASCLVIRYGVDARTGRAWRRARRLFRCSCALLLAGVAAASWRWGGESQSAADRLAQAVWVIVGAWLLLNFAWFVLRPAWFGHAGAARRIKAARAAE